MAASQFNIPDRQIAWRVWRRRFVFCIALICGLLAPLTEATAGETHKIVALGDMPYGKPVDVYPPFERLIETINKRSPDLAIHVGDIKSGGTPCSDRALLDQRNFMNSVDSAVLFTPGDNEWTDCHRRAAGAFDPIERLAFLRKTFFANPVLTLGAKPVKVERQSVVMPEYAEFVENARLSLGDVAIVTAHVVGSNNNFESRDMDAVAEFFRRDAASTAWLEDSFAKAVRDGAKAVIVAIHADMFEFGFGHFRKEEFLRHSGFKRFAGVLVEQSRAFRKPVLLVYGDSHVFRINRPFRKSAPNLIALEVFGASEMHAVEISIDPEDPAIFGFRAIFNPALASK